MDSYWSPATSLFSSHFDTNLHSSTHALQFKHELEDDVFDQTFNGLSWTAGQCEAQENQLDGFMIPESFDQVFEETTWTAAQYGEQKTQLGDFKLSESSGQPSSNCEVHSCALRFKVECSCLTFA